MIRDTYIPKEFMRTFKGFPCYLDIQALLDEAKLTHERWSQLERRAKYYHRSRGKSQIMKELIEAINEGKETDYAYNGEDEYPVDSFNSITAAKEVFRLLRKKGLLKYL